MKVSIRYINTFGYLAKYQWTITHEGKRKRGIMYAGTMWEGTENAILGHVLGLASMYYDSNGSYEGFSQDYDFDQKFYAKCKIIYDWFIENLGQDWFYTETERLREMGY